EALVHKLLQPLTAIRFGRVEVALRVGRDAVDGVELSRLAAAVAKRRQLGERFAIEDMDLFVRAIRQVEILLLRILRERNVPRRSVALRVLRDEHFLLELAVLREYLDAIVRTIADVDETVLRRLGAVHRVAELLD